MTLSWTCSCGRNISTKVKHRESSCINCPGCDKGHDISIYFHSYYKGLCPCDDLVKLGVAQASRGCVECRISKGNK